MSKFRLCRNAILFLVDILEPALSSPTQRSHAVPVNLQVLSVLYYLASGSFQRVMGDSHDINLSQSSISRFIGHFCAALTILRDDFISFPTHIVDIRANQEKFFRRSRLPNIVGFIDGTQVQIIAPSENEDIYVNRHNYHSINVQVICDYDYKITNIVARWPGSVHDSTILKESNV